jgi:DNA polymerase I-like protein with 3'-5' exonuclease and polymerase domains
MPTIDTSGLSADGILGNQRIDKFLNDQIYNALDCALTYEVNDEIASTHSASAPIWSPIYDFERALQGPYLSIMRKGFRVDEHGRFDAARELRGRIESLQQTLDQLSDAVWGRGLNPRSPAQLKEFFYGTGANSLRMPEQWLSFKGVRRLSVNREALEKLDAYLYARPFINIILGIRDLGKQLEVFESAIDSDGRFRAAYNIAGTETGRPSSSENAFGTGRNAQNIAPGLRYVFESDEGKRLCVIDLEQVEARDVGYFCGCLFGDWAYLDACESGDLHTSNARRIWPELGFTGQIGPDRAIADRTFYREFTYRDMAKRGSHLSNYMGTAWTASRSLKVPLGIMEDFQARYCRGDGARGIVPAFPSIPRWWQWTAERLQTTRELTTPFGRRRHFFGRPGDDTTLREAIAFLPQSTTADRMNLGLWRIWRHMPEVELLAQTYDSVTFQYSEELDESEVIRRALELIRVPLVAPNGRTFVVPGEAKVGWNWGGRVDEEDQAKARRDGKKVPRLNPNGLTKFSAKASDIRARIASRGLMQRDLGDFV